MERNPELQNAQLPRSVRSPFVQRIARNAALAAALVCASIAGTKEGRADGPEDLQRITEKVHGKKPTLTKEDMDVLRNITKQAGNNRGLWELTAEDLKVLGDLAKIDRRDRMCEYLFDRKISLWDQVTLFMILPKLREAKNHEDTENDPDFSTYLASVLVDDSSCKTKQELEVIPEDTRILRTHTRKGSDSLVVYIAGNMERAFPHAGNRQLQHYMSLVERTEKENIPADTLFSVSGRIVDGDLRPSLAHMSPALVLQHFRNVLPYYLKGKKRLIIDGYSRGGGMAQVICTLFMDAKFMKRFPELQEVIVIGKDGICFHLGGIGAYPVNEFPCPSCKNTKIYWFVQEDENIFYPDFAAGDTKLRTVDPHRRVFRIDDIRHVEMDFDTTDACVALCRGTFDHIDPLKHLNVPGKRIAELLPK